MIDVTPMTNADNLDPQRIVFDCLDDTVIANTNAVCMLGACESDDALGNVLAASASTAATMRGMISRGRRFSSLAADDFHSIR